MNDLDRDKINSNIKTLVLRTQWSLDLEKHLVSHQVFKQRMIEEIKGTDKDQETWVRQMYLKVQKRGPKAFQGLVSALHKTENDAAVHILDPTIMIVEKPSPLPDDKHNKVWNLPTYGVPPPETPIYKSPEIPLLDDRDPLRIKVKQATRYKGPPEIPHVYPMTKKVRGQCLIIDNEKFTNDILPFREGSMIDSNNLDILFEQLGFKVTLRRNLGYNDMMDTLKNFANYQDHAEGQMCVVIILSHGSDGGLVSTSDGREIPTEFLLRRFNNDGCPKLKGKPKFFILQACRGDEVDFGIIPRLESQDNATCQVDAVGFLPPGSSGAATIAKDPTWEDMVILYATVPGYVANRNLYRGTWLIECLCYVFMNHACEMDLREMLDEVARKLRNYESESGFKQSCTYECRHFYNKLYFNPGIVRDN